MENQNENQTAAPVMPAVPQPPAAEKRPVKIWVMAIAVLYVFSVLAGLLIVFKGAGENGSGKGSGSKLSSVASVLKNTEDGIGWVTIQGPIFDSQSSSPWDGGIYQWKRRIESLAQRKEVKAIVLEINSPGGSVGAVQELYSEILRIKKEKKKPVVAVFGDVAASGGYYIACACDRIVAHPGTLTGSIGVIFSVANVEGLFKKLGIKTDPVKSGRYKDIGSMTREMSPEERKLLQDIIDDTYKQFLAAIEDGRKIPEENLLPLADGRIFTGNQALAVKLVDVLGSNHDALDIAGELGGLGKNPHVIRDAQPFEQFFSLLDSRFNGGLAGMLGFGRTSVSIPWAHLEYMWTFEQ